MAARKASDMCVLVVEDQMAMRKIIKTVLQHIGVRVVLEAADGLEGLRILRDHNVASKGQQIDYVICDWGLPKMDGLELLKNIRGDTALKEMPFMMLTAEKEVEQVRKAIELGVSDYIVKPFSHDFLEKTLRNEFIHVKQED